MIENCEQYLVFADYIAINTRAVIGICTCVESDRYTIVYLNTIELFPSVQERVGKTEKSGEQEAAFRKQHAEFACSALRIRPVFPD